MNEPADIVTRTAEEVLASRTPQALDRLRQIAEPTDAALIRQALSDPDNPPLTGRQIMQQKQGKPITNDPVGLLLLHLEYGEHTEAELAEVIERVAEVLRRRIDAPERKAS